MSIKNEIKIQNLIYSLKNHNWHKSAVDKIFSLLKELDANFEKETNSDDIIINYNKFGTKLPVVTIHKNGKRD